MILDTSALLAILYDEPERPAFNDAVATEDKALSAANFVETSMVLEPRYGEDAVHDLDLYIAKAGIAIAPVDVEQAEIAREAFRRYGKGRHPAGLNFGDCFAYALAQARGEPLLFKGDDFARTDVKKVS